MTLIPFSEYGIVYGWSGTPNNVETTFPTYQGHPLIVRGRGLYDPGIIRTRADKLDYLTGFSTVIWRIKVLSVAQYNYFQDTYTVGGNSYSGKVTIRTRNTDDAFANVNAVLKMPKASTLTKHPTADAYRDVEIRFVVET